MEVVKMVMVETMVEIMRGKSRTTKTAADKLVAAVVTAPSTTAHMAFSHRKTAAMAAATTAHVAAPSTTAHTASSHRKTAAMATTTTPAAADERDGTIMGSAESILKVCHTSRLSWPQHQWG
jgi:hypothetical protein